MIDSDYMDARAQRPAVVRMVPRVVMPLPEALVWLPWQAVPSADGQSWCIRQRSACGKCTNSFGHFNNRLIAVNLAKEKNEEMDQ